MIAEMHNRIEATRLAFADALTYVADSEVSPVATKALLDKVVILLPHQSPQPSLSAVTICPGDPLL